jgi:hypothetical protein
LIDFRNSDPNSAVEAALPSRAALTQTFSTNMNSIVTEIDLVEKIIGSHKEHMGDQFLPYKNHVYRVLNFCFMFPQPSPEEADKLAIAAAFHDLGMWPGDQIDYLDPSIELARTYLLRTTRDDWVEEVSLVIEFHHRFRSCPKEFPKLVEVMRRGDWVDAKKGLSAIRAQRN